MTRAEPDRIADDREFWNSYARKWTPEFRGFQAGRSAAVGRYTHLGDEWGSPTDVAEVVDRYIHPFLGDEHVAAELGVGGGRVAARVAPRVAELHCLDIAPDMLRFAEEALAGSANVHFHLLESAALPDALPTVDFAYAFDVFVHLDLHKIWAYLSQLTARTRPGGHLFVHFSNLASAAGWRRFAAQERPTVRGHFFVCPQLVDVLTAHLPLEVVRRSAPGTGNFYEDRDDLVVFRRSLDSTG